MTNDKVREALEKIKSCHERNINHQTEKLDDIPLLINRALEALASDQWQPIETAPKDGRGILVYRPEGGTNIIPKVSIDYWSEEYGNVWAKSNENTQPTHWMTLPNPPEEK